MENNKCYMIIDIEVNNAKMYEEYIQKATPIVKKHGGIYLARGSQITPVTGNWNPERVVVIEFPSQNAIDECFSSQEYKEIAPLRTNSTTSRTIIIEGLEY